VYDSVSFVHESGVKGCLAISETLTLSNFFSYHDKGKINMHQAIQNPTHDREQRPRIDSGGDGCPRIPDKTIEAVARSLHREGLHYGFAHLDFVRFVNALLDTVVADTPRRGEYRAPTDRQEVSATEAQLAGLPVSEGRILLRALDADRDRPLLEHWLDNRHGRYFLLTCATARFDNLQSVLSDPNNRFAVICSLDGHPIGAVGFLHVDPVQRKAELRKLIGDPQYRGRGYAKEASRLWIRYGFEALGLRKIYLDTLKTNLRNIHLNESLGFKTEGVLRNEIWLDGKELDVLRMGLCRPQVQ
jgi:diamine N-acetyltransferase